MTAFDKDPNIRWLFCFTHPDDEISICAWIRRLVKNGNPVFLSWTHHNKTRQKEAMAAAMYLGVPWERLYFHQGTDASCCLELRTLLPGFQDMMHDAQPDRVACGAFEQGHIDHDTTNYLVHRAFGGPVFEIPFYHSYLSRIQVINRFSDPRGEELLPLKNEERAFKRFMARQYPSQNIWSVLLWYEALQRLRGKPNQLVQNERMRLQTHRDFRRPNHPEPLARRVADNEMWKRWRMSLDEFDRAFSLDPPE